MDIVRRLLAFLLVLLATYPAVGKGVCDEGDARKGPNCIHVEWVKAGSFSHPFSTVYRVSGKTKTVVWDEQGVVLKSTAAYLVVAKHLESKDLRCDWQGTRYAISCQETSD